jgi:cytochrome P450
MITKPVDAQGKSPPGPAGHFLVGSLLEFSKAPMDFLTNCSREYGDIVYMRALHVPVCLFAHPREIEYVLATNPSNFAKASDIRAVRTVMGNGLLAAEGASWQKQRKLVQPAFRHENFAAYGEMMVRLTIDRIDKWRDGQALDIHKQMMAVTLGIVAKSLLGADFSRHAEEVGAALGALGDHFVRLGKLAFLLPQSFPLPRTWRSGRATLKLNEIIRGAIEERRSARGSSNDLLEMLLRSQDEDGSMSDEQLLDEVKTLFIAGHETTANALSWTWYLLAQHPDVESALRQELATVLDGRIPAMKDFSRLPYTEMVIKESLRLYPATWAIGRRAIGAFETGGFSFPAGITIAMMQWNIHRDPRFFPQPDRFYPERWRADALRSKPIPRFAYFPFGGGPRVCVGAGFAMMETALLLATIAQRFRLTLAPDHQDVKPLPSLILRPENGIQMVVHKSN